MSLESGRIYKIINVKAGTVIDLSGTDGHSIIGWEWHGSDNQKWVVEQEGNHWVFRNQGTGKFLGIGGNLITDATPLTAVDDPVNWDIWPDERDPSTYRIFVPGQPRPVNVDLADHGNPQNGTPLHLWGKWNGLNQTWRFEEA